MASQLVEIKNLSTPPVMERMNIYITLKRLKS